VQDITDRVIAENKLAEYREQLEELVARRTAELEITNKELESFSYSVSHDLRAPLRAIDGFSQVLIDDYGEVLDGDGHDYLDRIRKGAQRMGVLIDHMLLLAQVSRHQLDMSQLNLTAMADEIMADLKQQQPDRTVDIKIEPALEVYGDKALMQVVLENLLGNAWKYTSKTPNAEIKFGLKNPGPNPIYYIKDNGAGFDQKYVENLFKPFQRLHTKESFEGTGVGLATVSRVIGRHGGLIWAEGETEKGACFYFSLPKAEGNNDRQSLDIH
jgi:light-regulated signal transduction histidine kinase (bacteriophytochrome)